MTATLADIRNKVRLVTKSPSPNQITDDQIDDYINNFYFFDFPEHLRLINLRVQYTFTCDAYVDTYDAPMNDYYTFHKPVFIAGYESYFTQDRTEFYRNWPLVRTFQQIANGDGIIQNISGTLTNTPVLRNNVLITAIDANGNTLNAQDNLFNFPGNLYDDNGVNVGTINYLTGAVSLNWGVAPAVNTAVNAQYVPYVPSRPTSILFFGNQFTLRPVPSQGYTISMEAYVKPTFVLDDEDPSDYDLPQLNEYWQPMAMGAALKIFEDRGDFEQIMAYRPIFDEYMRLINRRTIVQQTSDRSPTIYTDQLQWPVGNFFGGF